MVLKAVGLLLSILYLSFVHLFLHPVVMGQVPELRSIALLPAVTRSNYQYTNRLISNCLTEHQDSVRLIQIYNRDRSLWATLDLVFLSF